METLEPLDDRLLVKPVEVKEQTAGGLIIPANAQEKPFRGEVIAVGDTVERVSVRDQVLYSKYGGVEVEHADETLLMLRESDVLARVRES